MWRLLVALAVSASGPRAYLTESDWAEIRRFWPEYRHAASAAGVPLAALPAMHYLESDLSGCRSDAAARLRVESAGGPFMMDMGGGRRSSAEFFRRIRAYEREVAERFGLCPAPVVRDDFAFAALCAAWELREKARGPLFDRRGRVNMDVLADALWGYNGRAGRSWRQSPYVANDPLRGRLLVAAVKDERGGVTRYRCRRPGALALYREIEARGLP